MPCGKLLASSKQLQCKKCWYDGGEICIRCSSQRARHHLKYGRHCKSCVRKGFCRDCFLPPPDPTSALACHVCTSLALWCNQHCSSLELSSGLCRSHYDEYTTQCQHCSASGISISGESSLMSLFCSEGKCKRQVHVCAKCVSRDRQKLCHQCWKAAGSLCIKCGVTGARTEKCYMHCCKACVSTFSSEEHSELVRDESERYFAEPSDTASSVERHRTSFTVVALTSWFISAVA